MPFTVHMHVPRRMIAFPRDHDIPAPADLSHNETLPCTVTHVNPVMHSSETSTDWEADLDFSKSLALACPVVAQFSRLTVTGDKHRSNRRSAGSRD